MAQVTSILDLIGDTPLVDVSSLSPNPDARILIKLEGQNPGGSVKDRIALAMVEDAEKDGRLSPGDTLLEPSSGNTGIGLALVARVKGYHLKTADGSIGHVSDFIYDYTDWAIRYLVVETHNWWPGGKAVLIAIHWIDEVDWFDSTVSTALTRDDIKNSPAYDDSMPIDRRYEVVLHQFYDKHGYWSDAGADEPVASE